MVYNGQERERMLDYYFYKLCCNDTTIKHTYVGSTVNFTRRKSSHKYDSTDPKKVNRKIYATMANNGGWDNWSMVLIEKRFYDTKLEAHQHERFHYEQLNSEFALNMISPQRDHEEYYLDNKESIAARHKDYKQANKETILSKNKIYRLDNKEKINAKHNCICGGRYTTYNLQQHMKTNKHTAYIAQIKK